MSKATDVDEVLVKLVRPALEIAYDKGFMAGIRDVHERMGHPLTTAEPNGPASEGT